MGNFLNGTTYEIVGNIFGKGAKWEIESKIPSIILIISCE